MMSANLGVMRRRSRSECLKICTVAGIGRDVLLVDLAIVTVA
jgi:hypothetical protein